MSEHRTGTPLADDADTERVIPQQSRGESRRDHGTSAGGSRWKFASAVDAARYLGTGGVR